VLCLVYLIFLPFHAWALAVLIGLSALAVMLIGRPGDAVTAAITTAVVMVVAAVTPHDAWSSRSSASSTPSSVWRSASRPPGSACACSARASSRSDEFALAQLTGTLRVCCARSSTDRASDYGSEGWGFESLRARPGQRPFGTMARPVVDPRAAAKCSST
jgi:hypothetical protein